MISRLGRFMTFQQVQPIKALVHQEGPKMNNDKQSSSNPTNCHLCIIMLLVQMLGLQISVQDLFWLRPSIVLGEAQPSTNL